jgi:hypothetical protein
MAGDYYAILGVSRTATREEIQAACHRMSELYNSSLNRDNPFVENIRRKVEEARETLIDTAKRQAYDALLREREAAANPAPVTRPEPSPTRPSEKSVPVSGLPPEPSVENLRAFFARSFRAEEEKNSTFRDCLHSRIPVVVAGSVLLIGLLSWIFGLRITGGRFAFLLRSSYLALIGWGVYAALRHYTANAIFALLYSLCCAVIYAFFIVQFYIAPELYPEISVSRLFIRKIGVHFFIFYLTFFCSTQILEKGGFATIRERLFR